MTTLPPRPKKSISVGDLFKKLTRPGSELTFLLSGVLIFIVVVWYLISNIGFLVTDFNDAFNFNVKNQGKSNIYDIEGARQVLKESK